MSVPTIADIRAQLGVSRHDLARAIGCNERTIRRVETGVTLPSSLLLQQIMRIARARLEPKAQRERIPIHRVDLVRMALCLGKPGAQFKRWNGQQRSCYYAHRARYQRIVADVQAGRAILVPRPSRRIPRGSPQPISALLELAPAYDT